MIPLTDYPVIAPHHAFRRPPRWVVLAGAVGAASAVAITGCSGGTSNSSANSTSPAQKAIKLAASRSQEVNTLTAKLTEHSTGHAMSGLTGTIQIQLKPTTVIAAKFIVPAKKSSSIKLEEILTSKAIYFKDPAFTKDAGKAWVTVKISQLSSKTGVSVASLLQNLEGSNPLDQTRLFTASKDVKVVGSQAVNGVATTEYAGTYSPAAAFAQLPANMRKLLGPTLRDMGTKPVRFTVWIDAQHLIRKAQDTEVVNGQTFSTTFDVTSINRPLHIKLPAPSQIAPMPKL